MKINRGFVSNSSTSYFICPCCTKTFEHTDEGIIPIEASGETVCPWCVKKEKKANCSICGIELPVNKLIYGCDGKDEQIGGGNFDYCVNHHVAIYKIFDTEKFDPDVDYNFIPDLYCIKCFADDVGKEYLKKIKDPNCQLTKEDEKIIKLIGEAIENKTRLRK